MIRLQLPAAEAERLDSLAHRKASLRASLCYFPTMRPKVKSIREGCPRKKAGN